MSHDCYSAVDDEGTPVLRRQKIIYEIDNKRK